MKRLISEEGGRVQEACMFDIMTLPEDALRKVLPKVSIRIVSRLVACYPRAIGRTLMEVMSRSVSPAALEMMKDEINTGPLPSIHQIREAEKEFLRMLREENVVFPQPAPPVER